MYCTSCELETKSIKISANDCAKEAVKVWNRRESCAALYDKWGHDDIEVVQANTDGKFVEKFRRYIHCGRMIEASNEK